MANDDRRDFLKRTAGLTLAATALPFLLPDSASMVQAASSTVSGTGGDDNFWRTVQNSFHQSPQFINLDNGHHSPQPSAVIDTVATNAREHNELASFYNRRHINTDRAGVQQLLARFANCSTEEIEITRNATESLNILIMGIHLQAGDEAIWGIYEYGSMRSAFAQRAARDGIVNKVLKLPLAFMTDDEIVASYKGAITSKTKVILVSHMFNETGQLLPVRKICDMAHEHDVEVIVDGAHSFAHVADQIPDLHCDYYGASLHKWMLAPLGTGLLYIRKEKIHKVWPLFGSRRYDSDSIKKFNHIGVHPGYIKLGISEAIRFNESIGLKRKEARLRHLKNYWVSQLLDVPSIVVDTPVEDHRSCAITTVGIKDMNPRDLATALYDQYRILTVGVGSKDVRYSGVRICPNLYTTHSQLDLFVNAMQEFASA
jgi:selenocysteine lyase/cysteine desulfurase